MIKNVCILSKLQFSNSESLINSYFFETFPLSQNEVWTFSEQNRICKQLLLGFAESPWEIAIVLSHEFPVDFQNLLQEVFYLLRFFVKLSRQMLPSRK
jgi:hypothetical protein